jgi:hypothetical protein
LPYAYSFCVAVFLHAGPEPGGGIEILEKDGSEREDRGP